MKKSYEQMTVIELLNTARTKGVSIPSTLKSLKGIAYPTQEDMDARKQLIGSLDTLNHKNKTNWGALGVFIGLTSLIVAAIAIYL